MPAPLPMELLHPFGQWCRRNEKRPDEIAERAQALGVRCSARYVRFVCSGNARHLSYKVARALSAITGGEVGVVEMLEWRKPARVTPTAKKVA